MILIGFCSIVPRCGLSQVDKEQEQNKSFVINLLISRHLNSGGHARVKTVIVKEILFHSSDPSQDLSLCSPFTLRHTDTYLSVRCSFPCPCCVDINDVVTCVILLLSS